MLYQPFPTNWPTYTSRDRLADWLDTYAVNQNIVMWTKTTLMGKPQYDPVRGVWDVVVNRDGEPIRLQPPHIAIATGILGAPRMPTLAGQDHFLGTVMHAAEFVDAAPFAGKAVVVVGAGNSSIDVCMDLVLGGARSVTMVQRSSTAVVGRDTVRRKMEHLWKATEPVEVGDFKFASQGLGFLREVAINSQAQQFEAERALYERLQRAGVKINFGIEGEGQFLLVFERQSGEYGFSETWMWRHAG